MVVVGIDSGSLYRQNHSLSRLAWSWVGGRLAPFYIHHMNRVNSRNGHDDSTINIVLELQLLLLPCLLSAFYSLDLYCSIFITYLCNNWKQNKFLLSYFCSFIFFYFCKLRPILRLATCYILFFTFVYVNCIIQNVCNLLLVVNKRLVRWMNWCYICVVMLCSYSHGETVGVDELQPFLEPDYRCSAHQMSIISLSLHTSCQSFHFIFDIIVGNIKFTVCICLTVCDASPPKLMTGFCEMWHRNRGLSWKKSCIVEAVA